MVQYIRPGYIDELANTHLTAGVRSGDLIFVSGQLSTDDNFNLVAKGDMAGQARQVFDNINQVLMEAGGTLQDVVALQLFVTDMGGREAITPVRREYFGNPPPVSTLVQVRKLAIEGALLEVNAIAALGEKQYVGAGRFDETLNTHFSQGIRAGDLVFVAGLASVDANFKIIGRGDIAAQARQIFTDMKGVMREVGGSPEDVGWMHLFLTTADERTKFTPARFEAFGEHRPTATLLEISKFVTDDMLLEINAIGSVNKDKHVIGSGRLDERFNTHLSDGMRAGEVVFISGQTSVHPDLYFVGEGDIVAQTRQIVDNISRTLDEAGGTLRDIVWLQFFLTDISQRTMITPLRRELFGDHRPAATLIEINRLAQPEALIEVSSLAILES